MKTNYYFRPLSAVALASFVLGLGACSRQAWAQGACTDAEHALPLYVRNKVAFTTAERKAQKIEQAARQQT